MVSIATLLAALSPRLPQQEVADQLIYSVKGISASINTHQLTINDHLLGEVSGIKGFFASPATL